MQVVKLFNGVKLPLIALGTNTFGKVDHNWNGAINYQTKEIETALKAGYRFLDTAIVYRNEEVVGLAVQKSGLAREEVFIQTKLPSSASYTKDEEAIRRAVNESLGRLATSYIDVMLIHQPRPSDEENLRIYRVLENLVDEGKIKMLGVSNFSASQLDYLLKHTRIKPLFNQIEVHPGYWNEELIAFCQSHDVLVQAWSPLFRTSSKDQEVLTKIANKYHKSWAQVVLRYLVEKNVMVISKSHHEERQKENINIFDFTLSEEDKVNIASLNKPNFTKVAILGGTGFVGRALTSEALRLGYEVYNVSRHGGVMPQRHLYNIHCDVNNIEALSKSLREVDSIITSLNDNDASEYLKTHLGALEIAKKLNKPLIVIGSYTNLLMENKREIVFDTLDEKTKLLEQGRFALLKELNKNKDVNWTYISPSINVTKMHIHQPYKTATNIVLKDQFNESTISVIDLVDFALEISDRQKDFNHQQLTICNK